MFKKQGRDGGRCAYFLAQAWSRCCCDRAIKVSHVKQVYSQSLPGSYSASITVIGNRGRCRSCSRLLLNARPPASVEPEPVNVGIWIPVPSRIKIGRSTIGTIAHIAIGVIGEEISRVVGDDVENDVDSVIVGSLNEVTQFLACPKMGVDIEEILDTVAVIGGFKRDLAKNGAHPQGTDAQAT